MNIKEVGELRRRQRRDRSNMTSIYGCYVNGQKEIISEFRQSLGIMPENEAEKYFGLMKKVLSGSIGKNLIDISFQTKQVMEGAEHKHLMQLLQTELKDEQLRMELYKKILDSVNVEENLLILIGYEAYDVPFRAKDDSLQADVSDNTYSYLLCAVCPVKQSKANLTYQADTKEFHERPLEQIACAPEAGFLFPAFDNRTANIYGALFYSRSPKENHQQLVESIFQVQPPKAPADQKKAFESLLTAAVAEECSMEMVQNVHDQLCQCIDLHKQSKIAEPLLIDKEQVKQALIASGVSEEHTAKFSVEFDSVFGYEAQLHPKNIINEKRFEIKTPDVSITVNPERSDLIETRTIGGVKYIMICADEEVEVNGVSIHIQE